jgi:hypothetical protein
MLAKEKSMGAADKLNHHKKLFDTEIKEEVPSSPKQRDNNYKSNGSPVKSSVAVK